MPAALAETIVAALKHSVRPADVVFSVGAALRGDGVCCKSALSFIGCPAVVYAGGVMTIISGLRRG
jgi:hypothetical protein